MKRKEVLVLGICWLWTWWLECWYFH